jgi:hypothetical protein
MSWPVLLLAAAAVVLVALLAKLRGRRRGDLIAPPKRKPRHLSGKEEVLRQLKAAGYSEAGARRLVWLMVKLTE